VKFSECGRLPSVPFGPSPGGALLHDQPTQEPFQLVEPLGRGFSVRLVRGRRSSGRPGVSRDRLSPLCSSGSSARDAELDPFPSPGADPAGEEAPFGPELARSKGETRGAYTVERSSELSAADCGETGGAANALTPGSWCCSLMMVDSRNGVAVGTSEVGDDSCGGAHAMCPNYSDAGAEPISAAEKSPTGKRARRHEVERHQQYERVELVIEPKNKTNPQTILCVAAS
jgi:hypothetical protein